ncbi:MAG: Terminase-like family protein [Candidatus Omnitrophota bacterium]
MARMSSRPRVETRPEFNFDVDVAKFTERQMEAVHALDSGLYKYLLYGGALGGGKSYFLRWAACRLLIHYASKYGLEYVQVMLACEDYPSLKDRQIGKMAREFPAWLGTMYVDHREYGRCFILNKAYGSGVICLRNLDDPAKYQSAEFAAILVDELTKNDLNTFTDLRMRLRWPKIPDMDCVFLGATNPGGIGHAFCKALWMDKIFPEEFLKPTDYSKTFVYIPSKAEDNPHLDDAYWAQLQTLPPHLRAAFRDGSWDLFKGQAFQEWSRAYHVIEDMKFTHKDGKQRLYPEGAPLFMTYDWGFGAPFSIGWWWIDSDGRKYRFSEWYGWAGSPNTGMRISDTEVAAGVIKREQIMGLNDVEERLGMKVYNPQIKRLCDPTCFNKKPDYRGGGQMPSTAEVFMNAGLIMQPGDPSRVLKWRQFHEHLKVPRDADGAVNGVPMLQVYASCNHFIRTIPALIIDDNNIEDIDSSGEDHCADEAAHILVERPIKAANSVSEIKKQPTINDIVRLEREQIWEDVKKAEEMENALYDY